MKHQLGQTHLCFGIAGIVAASATVAVSLLGCAGSEPAGPVTGAAGATGAAGVGGRGGTGTGAAGTGGIAGNGGSAIAGTAGVAGSAASGTGGGSGGGAASGSSGGAAGAGGGSGAAGAGRGGAGGTATAGRGGAGGRGGSGAGGGTTGGAGLGGASLCVPGRYLLCEGFEGTAVGNTPPSGWTRAGNAAVAADQAARGAHALKVNAADNGERRFIFAAAESFGAGHWGRIFYKVQTPVPDAFVHSTLVVLQGNGPSIGNAEFRVVDTVKNQGTNATHQFLYNVQPSGAEFGKGSSYDWRFDGMWHCAEWHVDGATQTYQFFFDGTEVQQITIQNGADNYGSGSNRTHLPTVFTDMKVGWNNYQSAPPGFVAWIDEVAVDTARIGCDN